MSVMSHCVTWAKLRVMSVEDWPPISEKSMLNTMVERDDHYWASGCPVLTSHKRGEFSISSGVLAQDDAVLKEWVEKNGSFYISGGTCVGHLSMLSRVRKRSRRATFEVLAALPLMSNENLKEVDTKVKEQMKRRK